MQYKRGAVSSGNGAHTISSIKRLVIAINYRFDPLLRFVTFLGKLVAGREAYKYYKSVK